MIYYHCVVYTPFCGEETDVYIADTDYQYAEVKAYDAARENGMEWFNEDVLESYASEDDYLADCGIQFMEQITKNEYNEAMRDGEWCV